MEEGEVKVYIAPPNKKGTRIIVTLFVALAAIAICLVVRGVLES